MFITYFISWISPYFLSKAFMAYVVYGTVDTVGNITCCFGSACQYSRSTTIFAVLAIMLALFNLWLACKATTSCLDT